jgi:general secretion pathway protein D
MLALTLCSTLAARGKKGDKFFKDAQAAELKQDWDAAVDLYQKAFDIDPSDQSYIIGMRRARFQDGQMHVNRALKLRNDGKNAEALQELQKAIVADPSSAIALQELKRTQQMLQQQTAGGPEGSAAAQGLTPVDRARREEDQRVSSMLAPPELKPVLAQVPPLKMNNQPPRVLFETVGKLAGINVVFDSQYTPPTRGFNVELNASSVEQAFDYLAVITHTFWKPISSNTIFVTEDNVTKRRDYEDEVVKVFYITNATSTQEFQEIATAIRTVAEIRRVFTYNAQKAMVVRGPLDAVALAEKLVRDLDKPKSEVVVDVIVMETNSSRTRDLGAALANLPTSGLPISFTPRSSIAINTTPSSSGTGTGTGTTPTTTSTSSGITLNNLGHISTADFSTTLPGALLQAMLSDNRTKVVNRPQLRASDGMKVQLQIGDRIPYATGSFQPGVGTVGVSPLVSTQFQFADTGVTVDLTPQVHSRDELTLHIEITVSAVKQYITIGGTGGLSQPVIGQRKSIADIRLHEGEVNILSGLSEAQDSSTITGFPGLTNVPVLSNIFGTNHNEKDRQELMIALIPHIVRTPDYTPENLKGIYAGSDQVVKLSYAPRPVDTPAAEPAKSELTPATPATVPAKPEAPAAAPTPAASATPAAPAAAAPAPGLPPAPPPPAQTPLLFPVAPAGAPAGGPRVRFLPAAVMVSRDAPFTVNIQLDNAPDGMTGVAPLHIRWDASKLRLNDVTAGDLLSHDGTAVTAEKHIGEESPGDATVILMRPPGSSGVSGAGVVATLSFTATGAGTSAVAVTDAFVQNTQNQSIPSAPADVIVTVQ